MSIQFPKDENLSGKSRGNGAAPVKERGSSPQQSRPNSSTAIPFVMKTLEGRLLLGFLFAFNRVIRDLRYAVGGAVSFDVANVAFAKVHEDIEKFRSGVLTFIVKGSGGAHGAGEDGMSDLASHYRAVFVDPSCDEVRRLGLLFQQFDRMVLGMRMGVHQWDAGDQLWVIINEQVWLAHGMVRALHEVHKGADLRLPKGWDVWAKQHPLVQVVAK